MGSRLDYDESSIRVRPSPRSRPRTKDRPAHKDAVVGMVIGVDRGRWTCLLDDHTVSGMRARELRRTSIVVGDRVALVGDTSGRDGTLARIVRVEDRDTLLRRTADDTDPVERVLVANADQLAIVTALADPEPRPRMIDRCLVAAYDAGMDPLLVLTKADLADPEPFLTQYVSLGVRHVITSTDGDVAGAPIEGLHRVHELLADRMTVLVGHSGVGKSTLVNALVAGASRAIGHVNAVTGRGRHTSSSAIALPLPSGGWVVDTPGVRSFGLAHVDADSIIHHFPELEDGTKDCPRGCSHDEAECGLDAWVEGGHAGPSGRSRLESLRRLLRSRAGDTDDHDS
ncbi:ribosome small subunit-dependent GTPase A [Leekyejoonella antrihumi]|uniref:Small ribosomal subunit biogenesis GTPase RsgA n=1 Tax=Leekyejoonella antrihumi TaxID=1660198 RepID=A0A563DYH5_9MICO|nr:ribosome small subunit-dependent GTPase A [Leekyejoonella antrihumi]TWP35267.1 ribosome small subunit-dependent GTPase A [Leekyejoonella antrihumi]